MLLRAPPAPRMPQRRGRVRAPVVRVRASAYCACIGVVIPARARPPFGNATKMRRPTRCAAAIPALVVGAPLSHGSQPCDRVRQRCFLCCRAVLSRTDALCPTAAAFLAVRALFHVERASHTALFSLRLSVSVSLSLSLCLSLSLSLSLSLFLSFVRVSFFWSFLADFAQFKKVRAKN